MCLAIPMKIKTISETTGTAELAGVEREINLQFTPHAKVGDYVIVHAGFALEILDRAEAEKTLSLLREVIESDPARNPPKKS